MTNIDFAKNLVKGKIAETIFAQMLRETEVFTVLEFGYEKVIPQLIQNGMGEHSAMIETLRTAPDFAVINREDHRIHLIEVKYRRVLNPKSVLQCAERMSRSWNPSYLFVATLEGFYFGEINKIIAAEGHIEPLEHPRITAEVQARYLQLLQNFEGAN